MIARYTNLTAAMDTIPVREMIEFAKLICNSINKGTYQPSKLEFVFKCFEVKQGQLHQQFPMWPVKLAVSTKQCDTEAALSIFIEGDNRENSCAVVELFTYEVDRWNFIVLPDISQLEIIKLQGHKQVKVPCNRCQHYKLTNIDRAAAVFTNGCEACNNMAALRTELKNTKEAFDDLKKVIHER